MSTASWSTGSIAEALAELAGLEGRHALDVRAGKKRWIFYLQDGALVGSVSNLKSEQAEAIRAGLEGEVDDETVARLAAARRVVNASRAKGAERKLHEGSKPKKPEELGLGDVLAEAWASREGEAALAEATGELVAAWPCTSEALRAASWSAPVAEWLGSLDGQRPGEEVLQEAPGGEDFGRKILAQAARMGLVEAGEAPRAVDAAGLPELDLGSLLADLGDEGAEAAPDEAEGEDDAEITDASGHTAALPGREARSAPVVSVEVPAGHPMAEKLSELAERIDAAENHFQVLDMPWDASPSAFRQAYMTLAQQLHPDRFADAPQVLQERATGLFDRIREAWEVLGDEEERQAYIDKVIHGKKTEQELAMEQIQAYWSAEADFKRGLAAYKNGRISQAHPAFQAATQAVPDELEWKAYAAYTAFHVNRSKDPERAEASVELLKNVLEANKAQERKLDMGWVLLGKTYRERDMVEPAKRCFVQALRYNPANADAQLEMRRLKGAIEREKKGGFFSKLFGKK